jgi:predicted HD superfamily hydrolase involved in NAD metabolism
MYENTIKEIETYLKQTFEGYPKRLKHIYNVKKVAITLGEIYNADIPSVIVASYLHDITKINSLEENRLLASNLIDDRVPLGCIHAYAAYNLAKTRFSITNQDILNAVMFHCSGRKAMSLLEKIIFVSDFIEEDRDFVHDDLRILATKHLDLTVYKIMIQTKNYILKNKQEFSAITEEAIRYYQKELEELND